MQYEVQLRGPPAADNVVRGSFEERLRVKEILPRNFHLLC